MNMKKDGDLWTTTETVIMSITFFLLGLLIGVYTGAGG